jgi:type IV pilus assembly protein PilB
MSFLQVLEQDGKIKKGDEISIEKEVEESGQSRDAILLARGVAIADILRAKSQYYNMPYRDLEGLEVPFETLNYVPEESAVYYRIIPLEVKDGTLEIGIIDPENISAMDALNFISSKIHMPFHVNIISEPDFLRIIESYKGLSGEVTKALSDLETDLAASNLELVPTKNGSAEREPGAAVNIVEDAPITKIVATIFRYAIDGNASDIHIEPMREAVRVRYRVDGVLNTSITLPIKVHQAVVARIKILSDMRLDEKRKPQDGRFSARTDGRKIDFRVSTFPSYYGEKIVMRILDQEKGVKKIDDIGLTPRNLALIKAAIDRPYGLILITGPTGSGKSTTLYSMLSEIDRESENVLSLEDPVEYNIEGVSQSQVRPEIGYTFATGLRTTLRQDPDVIMVGEIRDKETAQLAIQAALTGHLVFSTIHTNTALGAIPRLVDMGVDPYLIAPTLLLVMGQRLVAKICPGTGVPMPLEGSIKMMIEREFQDLPEEFKKDIPQAAEVLGIEPTPECPKGVRGRQAVLEMFSMTKELEKMILTNPTETALWPIVRKQGMFTMKEDAILKALEKKIPFEEVNKL